MRTVFFTPDPLVPQRRNFSAFDNDDDERIGKVIVSEFKCFKEVQTMQWNQEVTQKPAEDTVKEIESETVEAHRASGGYGES